MKDWLTEQPRPHPPLLLLLLPVADTGCPVIKGIKWAAPVWIHVDE